MSMTWLVSGVFIVNFEHISHRFLCISIVDLEQVNVSRDSIPLIDPLFLLITSSF